MRISPINPAVIAMSLAVVAAPLLADDQHALDTEVAIVNLTGGDLHFEKKFNNMWTQWAKEPPGVITNTETVNFKMFIIDAAHFEICDGGATYRLDAGGTVSVRAANAVGGNWFYHQIKDVKPIPSPDGKGNRPACERLRPGNRQAYRGCVYNKLDRSRSKGEKS